MFAVVVILRDIIRESSHNKESRENERQIAKETVQPLAAAVSVPVAPVQVAAVQPEDEQPSASENDVAFSRRNLTMEEKYAALSSEYKSYFNDIVRFALSKEGVKECRYNSSYDYKDASYRVLRLTIKREEIYCEFIFINREMQNYANQGNVKFKQSSSAIKIADAASVGVAKDGINLVCAQIAEDREYKKNLAKEKRRERAKAKAAENAAAQDETVEPTLAETR